MKCFPFNYGEKKDDPKNFLSLSGRSNMSTYVEGEMKRSGSELNSQDVSDNSTDSFRRNAFPSMSQRPSNLRVFSVSELKCHEEFQPVRYAWRGWVWVCLQGTYQEC